MYSVTAKQLYDLEPAALAQRIDVFFLEDLEARYGAEFARKMKPNPLSAAMILASVTLQRSDVASQRAALLLFYLARFQNSLCHQFSSFENQVVHSVEPTNF